MSDLESKLKKELERSERLKQSIEEVKIGREESEERTLLLERLNQERKQAKALNEELQKYKDNDPTAYKAKGTLSAKCIYLMQCLIMIIIEKAAQVAKNAANRWTENVWEIQSYCVNNFNMQRSDFDKQFGIDDNFDTIP